MIQEDKKLLLKDLCCRLPYNPAVEYKGEVYNVLGIAHGRLVLCKPFMSHTLDESPRVEEVKPYLYPISSMLKEHRKYVRNNFSLGATHELFDFLDRNHYDYRGLIEKGLAIDATNLNIY